MYKPDFNSFLDPIHQIRRIKSWKFKRQVVYFVPFPKVQPSSTVRWTHLNSCRRSCQTFRRKRFLTVPSMPLHAGLGIKMETNRTSRFSRLRCPRMHRVTDSAVSAIALPMRQLRCSLLQVRTRSAHLSGDFGAQWLACVALRTDA